MPSDWIEKNRYLSDDVTPIPGFYSFKNTPYWKEPLNMLGPLSNIQKVVIVKGVQIGATTGVLENILAYNIGSNPRPQLYITADEELLKKRFSIHVERLIDSCNLRDRIFSQTGAKSKKTGDTVVMKEYVGGYLWGIGANNPNKIRSMPFPVIVMDELDPFKDHKTEGSAEAIADNRSNSYGEKRKILYISTPLVLQTSKIWKLYLQGDQRKFFIPCIHCGEMQYLEWHNKNDDGKTYGIVFDIDTDYLPVYETVGYKCKYCGKIMKNYDKAIFLTSGEWRPTAKPKEPNMVSYHLSALYSAPGMFSWEKVVGKWKDCWDLRKNKVKDMLKYREFRNLMQGMPFEEKNQQIRRERVQQFRNYKYLKNQIVNREFKKDSGSEILFLTCAVDCQKNNIFVHIIGWCDGGRNYMLDFFSIDGIVEDYNSEVWRKLSDVLEMRIWIDKKDGRQYKIMNTFIDSGHYTDYVYEFCKIYSAFVYPIKGEDYITGGLTYKMFNKKTLDEKGLTAAYHINTTMIKDRIARYFNLQWNTGEIQPEWYPNFPEDTRDDIFTQFESEERINEYDKITNKWIRSRWRLVPGRENHCFDTYCYNIASCEMFAEYVCRNVLDINYLDWQEFWKYAREGHFYLAE